MVIIDPVALSDVACARTSVATYYDRNGTLQTAVANALRVTYDPSDLTKAPYALVEAAATNLLLYSQQLDNVAGWSTFQASVSQNVVAAPDGTVTGDKLVNNGVGEQSLKGAVQTYTAGTTYTGSVFAKAGEASTFKAAVTTTVAGVATQAVFNLGTGSVDSTANCTAAIKALPGGWFRCTWTFTAAANATANNGFWIDLGMTASTPGAGLYLWQAQLEVGAVASSPIVTLGAIATRAADSIATGTGLVYSNVAIAETAYSASGTYALNTVVYDPATYLTYKSLIANNSGKALTDTTSWTPLLKVVNRWLMFDQYNNTQTTNPEEILVVVSPRAIAQGIFFGNLDANEVRISSVDLTDGLVYQEVQNQVISNSGSSFYNWFFKRIKKKSYAVTVRLPPYVNALVTIAIKKPGGTPKCGVCAPGPLVDVGLAQYGLSREIKDYSTVNFNFDGTSNVVPRNFAKILDIDVIVPNDQIDTITEELENNYRQKPVAWIGAAQYGCTCLFGPYVSFKTVIPYPTESTVSLQIQATV